VLAINLTGPLSADTRPCCGPDQETLGRMVNMARRVGPRWPGRPGELPASKAGLIGLDPAHWAREVGLAGDYRECRRAGLH